MIARTPTRAFSLLALAALVSAARAQTADPAIPPALSPKPVRHRTPKAAVPAGPNLDLILLDPAHGGLDQGARLGSNLLEKDVNLAFAQRLRALLGSRGFTVVLTRENDPAPQVGAPGTDPAQPATPAQAPPQITADARAEVSNRSHPLACLLLHSTAAGRGVHLYTSALAPVSSPFGGQPLPAEDRPIQLWDTTQASFLPQSQRLAGDLSQSIRNLGVPLLAGSASVAPMDAMACATVAVEVAPLQPNGGVTTQAADGGYQGRLANAIVEALLLWRSQMAALQPAPAQPAAPVQAPVKPKTRPKPRPANPDASPAAGKPEQPTPSGAAL